MFIEGDKIVILQRANKAAGFAQNIFQVCFHRIHKLARDVFFW